MHEKNSFITLTYNDEHLPVDWSLDKSHWQKFAKRMRRRVGKFRYFHCGEYTDEHSRPHYHAAIFGEDFSFDRVPFKLSKKGFQLYRSPVLEELWTYGYSSIGELTHESAAYVARYIMKKVNGPNSDDHYVDKATGVIRQAEYTTMSRNKGIGHSWLEKYASDVYPSDEVISQGRSTRPPRYYDKLHEELDPDCMALIKSKRKAAGSKHEDNNTRERLDIREEVQQAKQKTFSGRD